MLSKFAGIVLISILLVLGIEAGEWKKIETGTLAWLHAIHFQDEKLGWIGGSNGTLLYTNDGGATWRKELAIKGNTVRDIIFLDQLNGWMLCERGQFGRVKNVNRSYLLQTIDGGKSWTEREFNGPTEPMSRLFFDGSVHGYAVGEGGVLIELPDGRTVEKRHSLPVKYLMLDGATNGPAGLVLVGGGGSILRSQDAGRSWNRSVITPDRNYPKLNALSFLDLRRGWAAGGEGTILKTDDGGASWRAESTGIGTDLTDILFYDGENGVAVGENGIILRSKDGGISWSTESAGTRHRLEKLFKAGRKLFAIGFGGTLLTKDVGGH